MRATPETVGDYGGRKCRKAYEFCFGMEKRMLKAFASLDTVLSHNSAIGDEDLTKSACLATNHRCEKKPQALRLGAGLRVSRGGQNGMSAGGNSSPSSDWSGKGVV